MDAPAIKLSDLREMYQIARRGINIEPLTGFADVAGSGASISINEPRFILVEVGAPGTGSAGNWPQFFYEWSPLTTIPIYDGSGIAGTETHFEFFDTLDGGRTYEKNVFPLVEINGTTGIASGTRVWACFADSGDMLLFQYETGGGGGGSTVDVKGGNTPIGTITADTINFDTTYTVLSESPTGQANVTLAVASASSGGVLTTGSQHIAGTKTFDNLIYATVGFEAGLTRRILNTTATTTGANDWLGGSRTIPVVAGYDTSTLYDGCGWGFDDISNRFYFVDRNSGYATAFFYVSSYLNIGSAEYVTLQTGVDNGHSGVAKLLGGSTVTFDISRYNSGGHTGNAAFSINGTVGVSGTAPDGGVYTGGICTTLPTSGGSYTDEQAQDAVGGILTDSSTIDFTYDDAGNSITAIVIDNSISDAKMRQSAGLSVIGRSANTTGNVADITAANDGEVLRRSGTSIGFGTIATAGLGANVVTDAKLRQSSGLSVIGRSANTTGDVADITAGTDLHVLYRNGTTLGFGKPKPTSLTAVGAKCTRTTTFGPNNTATGYDIPFSSEDYDTDSIHDTGTNTERMTVPSGMGGLWLLSGTAFATFTVGPDVDAGLYIVKNGTIIASKNVRAGTVDTLTVVDKASAGDYYTLQIWHYAGSAKTWNWTAAGQCNFSATYLGTA